MTQLCKQVIIVRSDLKMGKGKIAAQASHASLSAFLIAKNRDKDIIEEWLPYQKKIVLKVESEDELLKLYNMLKPKFPTVLITDAGHTQVEPNTHTCIGIGPVKEKEIDRYINKLKLL